MQGLLEGGGGRAAYHLLGSFSSAPFLRFLCPSYHCCLTRHAGPGLWCFHTHMMPVHCGERERERGERGWWKGWGGFRVIEWLAWVFFLHIL